MISVVIPLYNKERQIAHTLRSALEQSFGDFEILIVNDGSTDHSVEEVLKIQDSRIQLIHQENAGVSAARNRGIEQARFDLIAFLDADDRWDQDYLKTQYELSRKYSQCDVFACNYEFVHADGSVHPTIIRKLSFSGQDGLLDNYFEVASCSHLPMCSSAVMIRKTALQQIGGFPVGIRSGEDLLTWAKLACYYSIAFNKKSVAQYILETSSSGAPPADIKSVHDAVSINLRELFEHYKNDHRYCDMMKYLAFWYKMRSRINLSLGNRKAAMCCAMASLKCSLGIKPVIFLMLAICPKAIINRVV